MNHEQYELHTKQGRSNENLPDEVRFWAPDRNRLGLEIAWWSIAALAALVILFYWWLPALAIILLAFALVSLAGAARRFLHPTFVTTTPMGINVECGPRKWSAPWSEIDLIRGSEGFTTFTIGTPDPYTLCLTGYARRAQAELFTLIVQSAGLQR